MDFLVEQFPHLCAGRAANLKKQKSKKIEKNSES
jgi:hypothetical protein